MSSLFCSTFFSENKLRSQFLLLHYSPNTLRHISTAWLHYCLFQEAICEVAQIRWLILEDWRIISYFKLFSNPQ